MNLKNKVYLVVSSGISKKTGQPYCVAQAVVDTDTGQFLSDRDRQYLDHQEPVGYTFEIAQSVVADNK